MQSTRRPPSGGSDLIDNRPADRTGASHRSAADGGAVPAATRTCHFVFMGVTGAGKSTLAGIVAEALGAALVEADAFHPEANVARMAAGIALTDGERWPWLAAVCRAARERAAVPGGRSTAIACSALKRDYRDFMRRRLGTVVFVHLHGPAALIRERMRARAGHFMPEALLDSQCAALEDTRDEADVHRLAIDRPMDAVAEEALAICRRHLAAPPSGEEGRA